MSINLKHNQIKFQIKDPISFLDFLGLELNDDVLDEKIIWLFKEQLKDTGLSLKLFELFTNKLIENAIVAKETTLVDASFIDVPIQRNRRSENKEIKENIIPKSFKYNPNKLSQKDCDTRWTKKNEYGYKDHIASDQKTKIITKYKVTNSSTHDSVVIKDIIDESDSILYGDSAYKSKEIEEIFKKRKY